MLMRLSAIAGGVRAQNHSELNKTTIASLPAIYVFAFHESTRDKAVPISRRRHDARHNRLRVNARRALDRYGLQFKRTRLKTIGRVCHGRQPVVWTALEAGSRKNKWPEESRNPVCAPRGERGCRAPRRGGVEGKDGCRGSKLGRKVYIYIYTMWKM